MDTITEFLHAWHLEGLAIGMVTFLIIGIFHPLVIKGHYYFGPGVRWAFGAAGVAMCAVSLLADGLIFSALTAVVAFSCFWSIKEVTEQEERVARGWFPANPRRTPKVPD